MNIIILIIVCTLFLVQLIINKQIIELLEKINNDIDFIKDDLKLINEHTNSTNKTIAFNLCYIRSICNFIKSYMIRRKNPNKD